MKKNGFTLYGVIVLFFVMTGSILWFHLIPSSAEASEGARGREMAIQATKGLEPWTTVDHGKHEILQQAFKSGDEITRACLSCHNEAGNQFRETIHWTWIDPRSDKETLTGKAGHSINNFCISTNMTNDKSCLACHTGWEGKKEAVNCLLCHSQKKMNFTEAFEDYNVFMASGDEESLEIAADIQSDIQSAAQQVIRPGRKNCGSCHFYGGGGDGVKHGDLDSSLGEPDKSLDVHMGVDGQDFACVRCHTTHKHQVAGRVYGTPAANSRESLVENDMIAKITCESCHTDKPHKKGDKPNDHTDKVACQSCHIPVFARENPTKVFWDWSKSGKTKDGKPYKIKGEWDKETYMSIKGEMKWAKNVKPDYHWFNGSIDTLTVKDKIDPEKTVKVSWPEGDRKDKNARIFPFKTHHGKQPYDKKYLNMLGPLLSGEHGYWETLDWQDALKRGSDFLGIPYSGEFGFVETTYVFPTTHMVAPKDNTVNCNECHVRKDSRMANLGGFYMPGRDRFTILDVFGFLLVIGSAIGVALHGAGRIAFNNRNKEDKS